MINNSSEILGLSDTTAILKVSEGDKMEQSSYSVKVGIVDDADFGNPVILKFKDWASAVAFVARFNADPLNVGKHASVEAE